MDCIRQVRSKGKSESEAWAICQESTGLKPHKAKGRLKMIDKLVRLADHLDEKGHREEADLVDDILAQIRDNISKTAAVAVTPCEGCGQDIYYRPEEGKPRYCRHCEKEIWTKTEQPSLRDPRK